MKIKPYLLRATVFSSGLSCVNNLPAAPHYDMSGHERRVYSQFMEDGIIEAIFDRIGETNRFFVEFGAAPVLQGNNTSLLREKGWTGICFDCQYPEDARISLYNEYLTKDNVLTIFSKYQIPEEFDFLSVDIDGNDFYVLDAILHRHRPRVVICEINPCLGLTDAVISHLDPQPFSCFHFGMSLLSANVLMEMYGYSMVTTESVEGINAFFVRNDLFHKLDGIGPVVEFGTLLREHSWWRQHSVIMPQYPKYMDAYITAAEAHSLVEEGF